MKICEFIEQYDFEDSIVLLEGKRKVLTEDSYKIFELGRLLSERTRYITFRSGNALGADKLFAEGVASVDKSRIQLITPYSKHRKSTSVNIETISLDNIDLSMDCDLIKESLLYKPTAKLVANFVSGEINRNTVKATYIIRDTLKVLGSENVKPAVFGIFYDDLFNEKKGGTGHTMAVCERHQIPIINQKVWFNWII